VEEEEIVIQRHRQLRNCLRIFLDSSMINGRYQSIRAPPSALTRPPGYEETVSLSRPRTASGQPLHTIEEEQSVASRPDTPDIPLTSDETTLGDDHPQRSGN
jgi:hypothetical protein